MIGEQEEAAARGERRELNKMLCGQLRQSTCQRGGLKALVPHETSMRNVELPEQGKSPWVQALGGQASIAASWKMATAAEEGVVNVGHDLQHSWRSSVPQLHMEDGRSERLETASAQASELIAPEACGNSRLSEVRQIALWQESRLAGGFHRDAASVR